MIKIAGESPKVRVETTKIYPESTITLANVYFATTVMLRQSSATA